MGHLRKCPYCGASHRLKSAFTKCERAHRPPTWKKSPK